MANALFKRRVAIELRLGQDLGQNPHQLVVNKCDTLKTGLFKSLNLLFDQHLKCGSADKETGRRARRIVENSANINILNLIKRGPTP